MQERVCRRDANDEEQPMNCYVIGAGGVGSWLAHSLVKLLDPGQVTLVDGDQFTRDNLDRQLFDAGDVGRNKAEALGRKLGCRHVPQFFSAGSIRNIGPDDWLLCCADNHPARAAVLDQCDRSGCKGIVAANETNSAEAYYYDPEWKGNPARDPRRYYPEILSVRDNDPRAAAIGCVGTAQISNRQLVSANFMAAALAQHLLVFWALERPKINSLSREIEDTLPYRYTANMTRLEQVPA